MEVHLCRFVESVPRAVHCVSFSASGRRLAVSRADADIEVWGLVDNDSWQQWLRFPGGEECSVEAIVWVGESRLLSAGLDSQIVDWNMLTLLPRLTADSYGGAVWSLALSGDQQRLVAGCEDGFLRMYSVADKGLEFVRSFVDRHGARILSCCWSRDDSFLVTGSADGSIRKHDASTGRSIIRISVAQEVERALVWSVVALPDGTVASCDSGGFIRFWDCRFGTQIQAFHLHEADVLTMVANDAGDTLYASGVDNRLVQLRQTAPGSNWVVSAKCRAHTHDIRALALCGNLLVSAGVDTALILYNTVNIEQWPYRKLPPFSHSASTAVATTGAGDHLLLSRLDRRLQLWRLGRAAQSIEDQQDGARLATAAGTGASQLLELKSKSNHNLLSSALSPDGSFIALSDQSSMRIFHLLSGLGNQVAVKKLKISRSSAAHRMVFTPDSTRLIVATTTALIHVFDLTAARHGGVVTLVHSFKEHVKRSRHHLGKNGADEDESSDDDEGSSSSSSSDSDDAREDMDIDEPTVVDEVSLGGTGLGMVYGSSGAAPIVTLTVSADGQWCASGDLHDQIHVFNLDKLKWHCTLPKYASAHSAIAFNPRGEYLVVACCNQSIRLFDLEKKEARKWVGVEQSLPQDWLRRKDKVVGISFDPADPDRMILSDHVLFAVVSINKPLPPPKTTLVEKRSRGEAAHLVKGHGRKKSSSNKDELTAEHHGQFCLVKRYQPLLGVHFLAPNSIAVVERPWLAVMEQFPPTLYRVRYGT